MPEGAFISQFSPQRTEPETLERILVQRHELIAEAVSKVRESATTGNKHHLLFIGPRGAGKTHLITLIHHRLSLEADLAKRLRFAWLNEDETSTSFLKLLIRIYRDLTQRYPAEFPAAGLQAVYGKDPDVAREMLGCSLLSGLGDRTLVILIENLDALFHVMPEVEQRTWRAFIQNHPAFATVATAQSLFSGVSDRDQPFFGFFDTIHLKPLSVEEAAELLEKLAEFRNQSELKNFLRTPRGRARLRAIHHLAGGNPRLYIILSDFLTQESLDDLVRPFMETVDRQLTAYYQERLRWLSAQQQEIVHFLCHRAGPVPVKEIAEGIFAAHNTTTGQLKQLREKRYVSFHPRGREVFYELAEPLMRLSFQVKETHNRQPLRLIVDFLRVWYDRPELEQRLAGIAPGTPGREYFETALQQQMTKGTSFRSDLLRNSLVGVDLMNCDDDELDRLHCLAEETDSAMDWNNYAGACAGRGDEGESLKIWSRVSERPEIAPGQKARALMGRAALSRRAGKLQAALADCAAVASMGDTAPEWIAMAWNYQGMIFWSAGNTQAAVEAFSHVINLRFAPPEETATAMYYRGVTYSSAGRLEDAVRDFTSVIFLPGASADQVANAFFSRGLTHGEAMQLDKAVKDFTSAITRLDAPREVVAAGLLTRGWTLVHMGRNAEAISDLWQVFASRDKDFILRLPGFNAVEIIQILVTALFNLTGSTMEWKSKARDFTSALSVCGLATLLGDALVHHLRKLAASQLNDTALDDWSAGWSAAGDGLHAMEIPLRLLRSGVGWIKTRDDSGLLTLPKEERRIVQEVLGLPADPS